MLIRDAYEQAYTNEDLNEFNDEIREAIDVNGVMIPLTFETFFMTLGNENFGDTYDVIGVYDSVVREKIFNLVAEHFNISYEAVYNKWLGEF